jgi:hypothetical protein
MPSRRLVLCVAFKAVLAALVAAALAAILLVKMSTELAVPFFLTTAGLWFCTLVCPTEEMLDDFEGVHDARRLEEGEDEGAV